MLKEQAEANQDRCEAVAKRDAELFTSPGHKPIAFTACREDRWPLAIQDCMIAAPDIAAWDACQTPEVRAGIERRR